MVTTTTSISNSNEKNNSKKELWCGIVNITSLPPINDHIQVDSNSPHKEKPNSWLYKYLDSNTTYLYEIVSIEGISLNLSVFNSSKENATVAANTLLTTLHRRFQYLLGNVIITPIHQFSDRFWNSPLYELVCPNPPYLYCSLIASIFHVAIDLNIQFRVFIQFKPLPPSYFISLTKEITDLYKQQLITTEQGAEIYQKWAGEELYSIRIFYQFGRGGFNSYNPSHSPTISPNARVIEESMKNSIMNYRHLTPIIRECGKIQIHDILFHTGMGSIMVPGQFDGHFNHQIPLPRTQPIPQDHFISTKSELSMLDHDIQREISTNLAKNQKNQKNQKNFITIGTYIHQNIETATPVLFNINSLRQSMSVFGLTRTGKTTFLANLLHDIARMNPNIGQLIFYLKNEKIPFDADIILNGDSSELAMPYLFAPLGSPIRIEELAGYIASGLGLLDNGRRYIINYFYELQSKVGGFPVQISDFLIGVLEYLENPSNQYGSAHKDIFQATKQRIEAFIGNSKFTGIYSTGKIPIWFKKLMNEGAKVVIDLQMFNPFEQRFLVLSILQMIRIYAKPAKHSNLSMLYVIDEAHRLFYKPITGDQYDSDNLGQYALDKILDMMINELANCGIGGVFADQNPFKLLDSIRNQIGTTVLFRISRESAQHYSSESKTQIFYTTMPDHKCFIDSNPQQLTAYIKPRPPFENENMRVIP